MAFFVLFTCLYVIYSAERTGLYIRVTVCDPKFSLLQERNLWFEEGEVFYSLNFQYQIAIPSAVSWWMLMVVQIIEYAKKKDFTSIIVVHTNRREPGEWYFWWCEKFCALFLTMTYALKYYRLCFCASCFLFESIFFYFSDNTFVYSFLNTEKRRGVGGCLQFWYLLLPHWVLIRILSDNFCAFALDALLIIGLPDGPTAHFKLSKLVLRKDIKVCCFCVLNFFSFFSLSHLLNLLLLS